ncbi:hypothetical protein K450DRAFT_239166 [Umbelopsis ramanniana AG]|uniref:Phosphatidic acid phosphatase type 2/haloperoxidase domain-containing protein n=1 Tax=Umbelopsis ramanniana AG TaxID=1314678 RepID=A0AAD5EAC4_UMBRA|nr:uncharacterized protein K450DRAFT_239166 [Umbelopsis ramanniana AG]KAI8580058.1 hypothetical protein K450DRAFT_239166 [Umbelopsis ramanniana AG]
MRKDVMRALAQVRVVIATMTAVAIIYFRSVHVCYIAFGGCIAAIVAKTLKIIIRQPRPAPLSKSVLPQAKGYGMPSSHSLVSAFFGVYLQALLLYGSQHPLLTLVAILVVNGFCCSVYLSRVHLGNHSPAQVTVGGILGSFIALFWYWQWLNIFAPWLQIHGQETIQNLFIYFGLNPSLIDYIYLH